MAETFTILAIASEASVLAEIGEVTQKRGHLPRLAPTAAEGFRIHREEGAELVILVLPLSDKPGAQALRQLRAQDPRATIVVIGRDAEIQGAPDALQLGAVEYLSEPRLLSLSRQTMIYRMRKFRLGGAELENGAE